MRVPPGTESPAPAEVFVPHVEAADEGDLAVGDDDLAVVPEIHLQARPPEAVGAEGQAAHARTAQLAQVGMRQPVRAELVEEEIHIHPCPRPLDESLLETNSQTVVLHDEKTHAHILLRALDRLENPLEGAFAVDEQLKPVAARKRQPAEQSRGPLEGIILRDIHLQRAQALVHRLRQPGQPLVLLAPAAHIALETVPPQQPIQWDRHERYQHQREHPCNGSLRGAHVHQGMQHVENAHRVEQDRHDHAQPRLLRQIGNPHPSI